MRQASEEGAAAMPGASAVHASAPRFGSAFGRNPNLVGIAAMVASNACFIVNDTFVKLASESLPVAEMLALRGIFATLFVLGLAHALGLLSVPRSLIQPLVLLRAIIEAVVALLFITALALLPLPNITAILQSVPLIITALSVVLFRATVGWRRWSAIIVGFVGVLLVVQPSAEGFEPVAILALISAFGVAVRDLVTRKIGPEIPSLLVTLSTMAMLTLVSFALAPVTNDWVVPDARATFFLACAALMVAGGNYFVVIAMRAGDIAVVSPFRYVIILFALVIGFVVWGDLPNALAGVGIALVVGSGLYTIHRERARDGRARNP